MDIKSVSIQKNNPESGSTQVIFTVTTKDGGVVHVPDDPLNRDYDAIRTWYGKTKNPGFKHKFEPVAEPATEDEIGPDNGEDGSGIALTADQTADARLPLTNLTREQRREIAEANAKKNK